MIARDEWGHDPPVQMMRRVFSSMEKAQNDLLRDLNLSLFDPRLRRARSRARDFFEQIWPLALQKGMVANESGAALLYLHCLVHTLMLNGIEVPDSVWLKEDRIAKFLREKLK